MSLLQAQQASGTLMSSQDPSIMSKVWRPCPSNSKIRAERETGSCSVYHISTAKEQPLQPRKIKADCPGCHNLPGPERCHEVHYPEFRELQFMAPSWISYSGCLLPSLLKTCIVFSLWLKGQKKEGAARCHYLNQNTFRIAREIPKQ